MRTDRREQLYDDLLRRTTFERSLAEQESLLVSVNLALTYDIQQSFLWRPLNVRGLARSSFNVMAILRFAFPEGIQLSDLGDLLITSRANVTGLVDHLEQKGYVRRIVDTRDRRARLAKLTKKGETLVDEILPAHMTRSTAFFSHLTLDEMRQLTKLLKKVRQSPALIHVAEEEAPALEPVFTNED